jgi:hypothetical protein
MADSLFIVAFARLLAAVELGLGIKWSPSCGHVWPEAWPEELVRRDRDEWRVNSIKV